MRRSMLVLVVVLGLIVGMTTVADASGPVRSGTMLGLTVPPTAPPMCMVAPDCAAWLASGCDARLAGRDPAAFASIVDVRSIAGTQRELDVSVVGGWIFVTNLEFWGKKCGTADPNDLFFAGRISSHIRETGGSLVTIPAGTRWMTVVTTVAVPFHWELW